MWTFTIKDYLSRVDRIQRLPNPPVSTFAQQTATCLLRQCFTTTLPHPSSAHVVSLRKALDVHLMHAAFRFVRAKKAVMVHWGKNIECGLYEINEKGDVCCLDKFMYSSLLAQRLVQVLGQDEGYWGEIEEAAQAFATDLKAFLGQTWWSYPRFAFVSGTDSFRDYSTGFQSWAFRAMDVAFQDFEPVTRLSFVLSEIWQQKLYLQELQHREPSIQAVFYIGPEAEAEELHNDSTSYSSSSSLSWSAHTSETLPKRPLRIWTTQDGTWSSTLPLDKPEDFLTSSFWNVNEKLRYKGGGIVLLGAASDWIFQDPPSPFTKAFLTFVPMPAQGEVETKQEPPSSLASADLPILTAEQKEMLWSNKRLQFEFFLTTLIVFQKILHETNQRVERLEAQVQQCLDPLDRQRQPPTDPTPSSPPFVPTTPTTEK